MNILIGVSGSISAYKILDVISILKKDGYNVQVIATKDALNFVTEMSLATISKNPVITDFSGDLHGRVEHVDFAEWADVMLIAPATANTLSKMSSCQLDNALLCTYAVFAGKKGHDKVVIAPAMNTHMYALTKRVGIIDRLSSEGCWIINPAQGVLACGEIGDGKLQRTDVIANITKSIGLM